MKMYTDKEINSIKSIIVDVIAPEKIILFGSYAYGRPREDSDLDFLVVKQPKDSTTISQEQELQYIMQINKKQREKDIFLPMDIFILSNSDVNLMKDDKSSALFHAVRKGKTLYEANDQKSRVV